MWEGQYPQSAWDAKIEGTAIVEGRVSADGVPTGLHVTAPVYPDLATAAIEAVSAARFEPARLNGIAVEVPLTVTIEFRLHQ
jgi:TonB family protein